MFVTVTVCLAKGKAVKTTFKKKKKKTIRVTFGVWIVPSMPDSKPGSSSEKTN